MQREIGLTQFFERRAQLGDEAKLEIVSRKGVAEKAIEFLSFLTQKRSVPGTHNPLIPGSTRASRHRCERTSPHSGGGPKGEPRNAWRVILAGPPIPFRSIGYDGAGGDEARGLGSLGRCIEWPRRSRLPAKKL